MLSSIQILGRSRIVLILSVCLVLLCLSVAEPAPTQWRVQFEPVRVVNGSPVLFRVIPPVELEELKANFLGHELAFRHSLDCHCWYALAGVNLETKPGKYELRLTGMRNAAQNATFTYSIAVRAAHYPSSTITVAPAFVEPP